MVTIAIWIIAVCDVVFVIQNAIDMIRDQEFIKKMESEFEKQEKEIDII